jgi:hypothetical protein
MKESEKERKKNIWDILMIDEDDDNDEREMS